jgi:hypothetical protein
MKLLSILKLLMGGVYQARVKSFSPTTPPRFDRFYDAIQGFWYDKKELLAAVEEVMHSCGDTVGISEAVPIEAPQYLNRANDGFIYSNDGSYSSGPIKINSEPQPFWTSLMVGKGRRLLLYTDMRVVNGTVDFEEVAVMALTKKPDEILLQESDPLNVDWQTERRCRMSTPSQPWNLQRATWEVNSAPVIDEVKGEVTNNNDESTKSIQIWFGCETMDDSSVSVTIGAICYQTNICRAFCRDYNSSYDLTTVSYGEL